MKIFSLNTKNDKLCFVRFALEQCLPFIWFAFYAPQNFILSNQGLEWAEQDSWFIFL